MSDLSDVFWEVDLKSDAGGPGTTSAVHPTCPAVEVVSKKKSVWSLESIMRSANQHRILRKAATLKDKGSRCDEISCHASCLARGTARDTTAATRRVSFNQRVMVSGCVAYDRRPCAPTVKFNDRPAILLIDQELKLYKRKEMRVHPDSMHTSMGLSKKPDFLANCSHPRLPKVAGMR